MRAWHKGTVLFLQAYKHPWSVERSYFAEPFHHGFVCVIYYPRLVRVFKKRYRPWNKSRQIFQGIWNASQFLRRSLQRLMGFFKHEMFLVDNRLECCGFLTSHSLTAKLTYSQYFFAFLFSRKQFVTPFWGGDNCLNICKWPAALERF